MLPLEKLTTVQLKDNIGDALDKINQGDFLSLPVMDGNEFKGIIMKEAIYRNFFDNDKENKEKYLAETRVEDLYRSDYEKIFAENRIENASYLLREFRTPFLPVFDKEDKFVGILTHFAIFNAFSEILGIDKGMRIVINMYDLPGQMAKLTEIIKRENANIINLAILDPKVLDLVQVILRVETDDGERLIERIQAAGFRIGDVAN